MILLNKKTVARRARGAVLATGLALGLLACGDDDDKPSQQGDDSGAPGNDGSAPNGQVGDAGSNPGSDAAASLADTGPGAQIDDAGASPDSGAPVADPVYIVAMRVWAQDGNSFQYIKASRTLEPAFTPADYAKSVEVGAYAGITVQDGYVLVGEQNMPFVTKYEITPNLEFKKVGETLNFSTYFQGGDGLNDFTQIKKGNDQFFFYGSSSTARVHWKVKEWNIAGKLEDTKLPIPPAGYQLTNGGNRTRVQGFKDAIVWPFVMQPTEDSGLTTPGVSYLAVYDGTTFTEKTVIQPSCLELWWSTMDEAGNLYFSTRSRNPAYALYGETPENCVVKVKPDGTVDESFGPKGEKTFSAITGGKQAIAFKYLSKGKAAVVVLDTAAIQGANWDGPVQEDVICQIEECEGKADLHNPGLYTHYVVDLASNSAKQITGYAKPEHGIADYRIYWNVDGRSLFMSYDTDGGLAIYELNVDTAEAKLLGNGTLQTGASGEYTVMNRVR